MNTDEVGLLMTILILVAVTLGSGPLTPLTLTEPSDLTETYDGMDDVEQFEVEKQFAFAVDHLPTDELRLEQAEGNSEAYRLGSSEAIVLVDTGPESAVINYTISIPELGYRSNGVARVAAASSERIVLTPEDTHIPSTQVSKDTYNATLLISVYQNNRTIPMTQSNATVIVV